MNFKFLKNTKLASLLMVSLNSVPSILASNTNNIVNNSFNINEVATNGSSITKKNLIEVMDIYLHNLDTISVLILLILRFQKEVYMQI